MRRTLVASVAGLGLVGSLAVPVLVPLATPDASAALLPPEPAEARLIFSGVPVADSPDTIEDIWDVVPDGSDQPTRRVDSATSVDIFGFNDPSYSPDGTQAVFVGNADSSTLGAGNRLMTIDLTDPLATPQMLNPIALNTFGEDDPDWSPDGKIAYITDIFDEDTGFLDGRRLRVRDVATGAITDPIAEAGIDYETAIGQRPTSPAWSPDGTRLLFVSVDEGDLGRLWLLDLESGELLEVSEDTGAGLGSVRAQDPVWSPDGTQIAWVDETQPITRLVLSELGATATGPDHSRVTVTPEALFTATPSLPGLDQLREPAWSPDGEEIAVVAVNDSATTGPITGIYAIAVADATVTAITTTPFGAWEDDLRGPDYQPWSDLEVTLSATASEGIDVADRVDLTATVTNNGPSPAWDAQVEVELPGDDQGLELAVAWPAECDGDGGDRTCTLSEPLAPGDSAQFTLSVIFTEPGGFSSYARATADTVDPATADNVASVTFEVDFPPALGIEPRLALGYGYGSVSDRRLDLADLRASDATDFRMLVDEVVTDDTGAVHRPAERHPSYSPDGRRIVFSSELHELIAEGSGFYTPEGTALFVGDVGPGPGRATNVEMLDYDHTEGLYDIAPAWSPDGSQIAFLRYVGDSAPQIAVVDTDTPGALTRIIQPDAWESETYVGSLSWSPDGERLVVEADPGLSIIDVAAGTATTLLTEVTDACGSAPACLVPVAGSDPAWSPDGTQIAYVDVADDGARVLRSVEIGAAADEYVVPTPVDVAVLDGTTYSVAEAPTWSLDSGSITFVARASFQEPGALLTVPAAGGTPSVLRDTFPGANNDITDPVYQPWADVAVELAADPAHVGRPFVVHATVTNNGPSPAWGTLVIVEIPAVAAGDAELETWPAACEVDGSFLTCTPPDEALPVGTPLTWDIALRVSEPGTHVVQADATTRSIDPEQSDNAAVLSIGVEALPDSLAEPHLAFTRWADTNPVDLSNDIADVPAQRGPTDVARLLAHETLTTSDGRTLHPDESHPSYSPDGTRLAFDATGLVEAPDGEELSELTRLHVGDLLPDPVPGHEPALVNITQLDYDVDPFAADSQAAWSPDGSRIAFTRETDSDYGRSVQILDVATGDVRALTPPNLQGVETMSASWAPGSDRLVVEVRIFGEDVQLWIVHLDPVGDTWYPVGEVAPSCTGAPLDCLNPWRGFTPAWSPDGTQLAAGDAPPGGNGPSRYSVIDILDIPAGPTDGFYDVTASSELVGTFIGWDGNLPAGQFPAAWHPAWSPDGTQVSFVGRATEEAFDAVYVIPAAGGTPQVRVAEWSDDRPGHYANPAYQPAASDVALTLEAPSEVGVDVPFDLTATVTNAGPGRALGTTVAIDLPSGYRVIDAPSGCATDAGTVTCAVDGTIPVDGEVELVLTVAFENTGPTQVTGTATSATLDPEPDNDTDVVEIDVLPVPPATGIEPRLAFSYVVDTSRELPSDLADVFWADGEDFRVIADERVSDPDARTHRATETDPSYSPDGRQMVFSARRTLSEYETSTGPGYEIDWPAALMIGDTRPGPTGLVNVEPFVYERPDGASDVDPVWSPDGTQIAFVRSLDDDIWLAVADVATGDVRYVEDLPYWINDPSWSPDGERLVVDATDGQGSLWVVHVDPDGDEVFPVVVDPPVCDLQGSGCPSVLHEPSWSPDGTQIAYLDGYVTAAGSYAEGLFTLEIPSAPVAGEYLAGPARRILGPDPSSTVPTDTFTERRSPAWSLDGTSLALVERSYVNDAAVDAIMTVPSDGGALQLLRDEVRDGLAHSFADLVYQPWADLGVAVTPSAPTVDAGELVDVTVTVTNHGPAPAWGAVVDVTLPAAVGVPATVPPECTGSAGAFSCTADAVLPVDAGQDFTFTLVAPETGSHETAAEVTSRMIDPVTTNDTDAAAFEVRQAPVVALLTDVAVTLDLGRPTGWVGGDPVAATVVVTNNGPGTAAGVAVELTTPAGTTPDPAAPTCASATPCAVGTLASGQSRTIVVDLVPTDAGIGTVTATVTSTTQDTDPRNNTDSADLEVLQPTLRLLPTVTTPGEATLAYGVDFPPGAQLTLSWSRGITPWLRPITVQADGTMRSPLLVLAGDELGERIATATGTAGPAFGDVEAPPMLVVPRTYSPPNFLTRG